MLENCDLALSVDVNERVQWNVAPANVSSCLINRQGKASKLLSDCFCIFDVFPWSSQDPLVAEVAPQLHLPA